MYLDFLDETIEVMKLCVIIIYFKKYIVIW